MADRTMPAICPSCGSAISVVRLNCGACGTAVEGGFDLSVLARLSPEDQAFVLEFVKSSGSLKAMARHYGISYPTVRNRMDALIERVRRLEATVSGEERE